MLFNNYVLNAMLILLNGIFHELIDFFRLGGLLGIFQSGNYRALLTIDGFLACLIPLAPIIIIAEMLWVFISQPSNKMQYKVPILVIITNRALQKIIGISVLMTSIAFFRQYALFQTTFSWYWIIYGYLVYELNTFIRHYATHKIRLLWCFHSVHHSPKQLNSSITLYTFFIENIYTEVFASMFCMILGVNPIIFFMVMVFDSIWGAVVHSTSSILKDGKLGWLEPYILTPSHHRVHHASNDLYMDTNFCSIINIWDKLFGTYQEEAIDIKISYGTTRKMDSNSFSDVYFGELRSLWSDINNTSNWKDKCLYVLMPPGWKHIGEYQTAQMLRDKQLLAR